MWNVTKCDEQEVFLRSLILLAGNQLKNRASVGRKLGILLGIDERNVETAIDEICTKYRHRRGLGKAFLKKVLAYEPPEAPSAEEVTSCGEEVSSPGSVELHA